MLLLLCVVVVLANLHSGVAQTVVNGGTLSNAALLAAKKAVLTINVDNDYQLYWNGEFVEGPKSWQDTTVFNLIPVPICNYPNVLAIKANDYGGVAGAILQLEYAGVTYKMGTSPEILLADAYSSDPAWYVKPFSDPAVWTSSNALPSCKMDPPEEALQQERYQPETYWRWTKTCGTINNSVFIKLVLNTKQSSCCH